VGGDGRLWPRDEILARARMLLARDGSAARREIVKTTLELERLLVDLHGRT
jgi:hypothetical protein